MNVNLDSLVYSICIMCFLFSAKESADLRTEVQGKVHMEELEINT